MKAITRAVITAIFIVYCLPAAGFGPEEGFSSGNYLYSCYLELKKGGDQYPNDLQSGIFVGYIAGVRDIAVLSKLITLPAGIIFEQLCDVVGIYLENHPEERHKSAGILIFKALQSAFPYKEK
jgi:hypothetical protein